MWQPQQQTLNHICELLDSSKISDNMRQKQIYQEIETLSYNAEFSLYLSYIFGSNHIPILIRQISGLTLKSVLKKTNDQITAQHQELIKQAILIVFNDQQVILRRTSGILVTFMIQQFGFKSWPQLIQFFEYNLQSQDLLTVENTIDCIAKIVEDIRINSENIDSLENSDDQKNVNSLIPKLISFCDPQYSPKIRQQALFCLNLCIFSMPSNLAINSQKYLNILIQGTQDSEVDIRLRSIQGIISLNETRRDVLMEQIQLVLQTVIKLTADSAYEVSKNACLFWPEYLASESDEDDYRFNLLKPYLNILLPILIDALQYSQEDLINLLPENQNKYSKETQNEFDDIEDNDNKEDFFDHGEFTLRRLAGQTIDKLSQLFENEIFLLINGKIDQHLGSQDWKKKESAILTLGAIAEGQSKSIQPYLQILIPYLIKTMKDPEPLIRVISCWSLSKYIDYIMDGCKEEEKVLILKEYLANIMICVMDSNEQVQESACSSFSRLIMQAAHLLIPFMEDVIQVFANVFMSYQGKSLNTLYSAIMIMADSLQQQLQNQKYIDLLMPSLMIKWSQCKADDVNICPLLECFVSISTALEHKFNPYLEQLFPKLLALIELYIETLTNQDNKNEYHRREAFLRVIDLFSSVLVYLKEMFSDLVINSNLYQNIMILLDDKDFQVRQFIFSFVGEIAKYSPNGFQQYLEKTVPVLINNIYLVPNEMDSGHNYLALCNNSVFSLTELSFAYIHQMKPLIPQISQKIIQFLLVPKINRNIACNFSKSLGRLATIDAQYNKFIILTREMSKNLSQFIIPFCLSLRDSPDTIEKQQAFRGLIMMFEYNSGVFSSHSKYILDSIGSFQNPDQDIKQAFQLCLNNFQNQIGQKNMQSLINDLSPIVRKQLNEKYGF